MSDAARQKLTEVILSELPPLQPDVAIAFENTKFTQPTKSQPWIMVAITPNVIKRRDIGSKVRTYEHLGIMNISVMVASDSGTGKLQRIADSLTDILMDAHWPLPNKSGSLAIERVNVRNRGWLNNSYVFSVIVDWRQIRTVTID